MRIEKEFQPIKITITVESKEEREVLQNAISNYIHDAKIDYFYDLLLSIRALLD